MSRISMIGIQNLLKKSFHIFIFCLIFSLAAFFRLYGVNWDKNQHLHPDERFLTMVTEALQWPRNVTEYLDANTSPLNPHNKGFGFFVYGTFPIIFTRWVTDILGKTNYTDITLTGRRLSALFDLGTVVLVFLIAQAISSKFKVQSSNQVQNSKLKKNQQRASFGFRILDFIGNLDLGFWIFPFLASFFYASMVLPIQLSHFFAVDTYLTFFITLSFYFLTLLMRLDLSRGPTSARILWLSSLLGIALGLATASKITALLFLPIIIVGVLYSIIKTKNLKLFLVPYSLFLVFFYLTLRFAQPYLFAYPDVFNISLNQKVINNWKELKSFSDPSGGFPPGVQWITTKPYVYSLKNFMYWAMGLPMGLITICSVVYVVYTVVRSLKKRLLPIKNQQSLIVFLATIWSLGLFLYQSTQFSKPLRYLYPMFPFLALISGYFITMIVKRIQQGYNQKIGLLTYCFIGLLVLIYPISFLSLYTHPHSRIAASEWIYQNIPTGSVRSVEHWDDGLPLSLPKEGMIHEKYPAVEFPLYWPDNAQKWDLMVENLKKVDYVILSSNRLYGALTTLPQRYPTTYRYYTALFDGTLGFEKAAEFSSRPNLPIPFIRWCITPPGARYGVISKPSQECSLPGISFVDDYADETFTVYDHPKVIIFKKIKEVDYKKILHIE